MNQQGVGRYMGSTSFARIFGVVEKCDRGKLVLGVEGRTCSVQLRAVDASGAWSVRAWRRACLQRTLARMPARDKAYSTVQ